jgi:hypothetical protein
VAVVPVVRLFGFQPTRPAFDNVIRDSIVPAIRSQPGVIGVYAGRHGPDELGPRLIISVWNSRAAMDAAFGVPSRPIGIQPEERVDIADGTVDVLEPEVAYRAEDAQEPHRIIRILRGCTQTGARAQYVEEARAGVAADVAAGHGPTAFYLAGGEAPEAFVAVSVWNGWPAIAVSTGGDVRRPTATRRPELIAAFDATHYEAIDL